LLVLPLPGETSFVFNFDLDLSFIKVDRELDVFGFVCLSEAAEEKLF